MVRLALVLTLLGACGKELNPDFCAAHRDDERCTASDARTDTGTDVSSIDAPMATRIYVGTTSGVIHTVDPATMDVQEVGTVDGSPSLDGLALDTDGSLLAIIETSKLVRIAASDASMISKISLSASHSYWGLTVANGTILAAAQDTASLYEVSPTGTVTLIGAFGNSLAVAGDISFVPGVGLFASVQGGACSGTCIASVSMITGAATLLAMSGPGDLWALASFNGELWAVGGSDDAYLVNQTSGVPSQKFSTSISGVSDAAP